MSQVAQAYIAQNGKFEPMIQSYCGNYVSFYDGVVKYKLTDGRWLFSNKKSFQNFLSGNRETCHNFTYEGKTYSCNSFEEVMFFMSLCQ
jgi:hypothetical protein